MTRRRTFDPASVALAFWRRDDVRVALARREVGTLFGIYLEAHPECTQTQLALLTGHDRSDVSNFVRGARSPRVADIDVLTRIADGLDMPDEGRVMLGLAPADAGISAFVLPRQRTEADADGNGAVPPAEKIGFVGRLLGVPDREATAIARMVSSTIEIDMALDIDIAEDGDARLVYTHRIGNVGPSPVSRVVREVWFKHTTREIAIEPVDVDSTSTMIQIQHGTPSLVKFACQVSPPVLPGTAATIQYIVEGGRFVDEFYWRQTIPRYVHDLTIRMRQRGVRKLRTCTAVEEQADGSERSATDGLTWEHTQWGIMVTLARHQLWPNQAVTLRWDTQP